MEKNFFNTPYSHRKTSCITNPSNPKQLHGCYWITGKSYVGFFFDESNKIRSSCIGARFTKVVASIFEENILSLGYGCTKKMPQFV
jgi:hypothetical protein